MTSDITRPKSDIFSSAKPSTSALTTNQYNTSHTNITNENTTPWLSSTGTTNKKQLDTTVYEKSPSILTSDIESSTTYTGPRSTESLSSVTASKGQSTHQINRHSTRESTFGYKITYSVQNTTPTQKQQDSLSTSTDVTTDMETTVRQTAFETTSSQHNSSVGLVCPLPSKYISQTPSKKIVATE